MNTIDTIDGNQALTILINAAHIGQKAGIFSLAEAELISKSIRHFSTPVELPTINAIDSEEASDQTDS